MVSIDFFSYTYGRFNEDEVNHTASWLSKYRYSDVIKNKETESLQDWLFLRLKLCIEPKVQNIFRVQPLSCFEWQMCA